MHLICIDLSACRSYVGQVRWESLFNDLESQLRSMSSDEEESEISERTRSEQSRLMLVQRLDGQRGNPLGVVTRGGRSLFGVLAHVGSQWIAMGVENRTVIVPLASIQVLRGLRREVGQPLSGVQARLGLGSVMRELSRDRAQVSLWLGLPATCCSGVVDRVGADFLELGSVAAGDERRTGSVREVLTVPFASIDTVDSAVPME